MSSSEMSTCSVCGDTKKNAPDGSLPKWWVREMGKQVENQKLAALCGLRHDNPGYGALP